MDMLNGGDKLCWLKKKLFLNWKKTKDGFLQINLFLKLGEDLDALSCLVCSYRV